MTYSYCKKIITACNYDKTDMIDKLDVFLLNNRITQENYEELVSLINTQTP